MNLLGLHRLSATYRVSTPLFGGGFDLHHSAEVRLPAFLGQLRFWWRTLHGHLSAAELAEREAAVFGTAAGGKGVGQRLTARLTVLHHAGFFGPDASFKKTPGRQYLAYGLCDQRGDLRNTDQRKAVDSKAVDVGTVFELTLVPRQADAAVTLQQALVLLGTCGGVGARSRRGFGSVTLLSLNGRDVSPKPVARLEAFAAGSLRRAEEARALVDRTGLPAWTCLSPHSRLQVVGPFPNAVAAHDAVGREMVRERSFGHKGQTLCGERAEQNFRDDHDAMQAPRADRLPRRAVYGLPHNYFFSTTKQKVSIPRRGSGLDRRASPLLLHVDDAGLGGEPGAWVVATLLPSEFLPRGQDAVESSNGRLRVEASASALYRPLVGFLKRLSALSDATYSFEGVTRD